MKTVNTIIKVLSALAAAAAIIYLIATYGDKIVAWAKEMMEKCPCKCSGTEEAAEEAPTAEEEPVEEEAPAAEETPAEEVPASDDNAPVANEEDFEA